MKRRMWDSAKKVEIVLKGLKGRPVAEISNEYEINQAKYILS